VPVLYIWRIIKYYSAHIIATFQSTLHFRRSFVLHNVTTTRLPGNSASCNVRRIKHINRQSHHLSVILYLIFLRQLRYVGHFPDSKGLYTPHTILHKQQITSPWLANSKYTPNKAHDWSYYVTWQALIIYTFLIRKIRVYLIFKTRGYYRWGLLHRSIIKILLL